MNGDIFVPRIRQILQDWPDFNRQGTFWNNYEIENALNLAQTIFTNYVLQFNKHYFLNSLIVNTGWLNNSPIEYFANSNTPPLLHPIEARALVFNPRTERYEERIARIYWGDGIPYLTVGHEACFIIKNTLFFTTRDKFRGGSRYVGGKLTYYTYPSRIFISPSNNPFVNPLIGGPPGYSEEVYWQFIVPYASLLLGLKEITNQRDFKNYKNFIKNFFATTDEYENFTNLYEFTGKLVRPGRPPSEDLMEGGNAQ